MDPAALTRALTYIQANLDGDLSLEALSEIAGCSPPYFARRFAAMMAETPKQYTSRLRLETAVLRLILLDDGILEIALDCGFSNHETFSRAFRRRVGVAPHVFRRKDRLPTASEQELPQRADAATPASLSSTVVRTLQPMSLAFIRHTGPYENAPIGL
jgi:AraC family transcriptional regulator